MRWRFLSITRWFLVTVGIIVLTSFTIDATSNFSVSQSALGILAREVTTGGCPSGMSEWVTDQGNVLCFDVYEVSPNADCPHTEPKSVLDATANIQHDACYPISVVDAKPWTYVTVSQARELCAKAGKRLPTAAEWYRLALATPDKPSSCNADSNGAASTGRHEACVSGVGAYDMIGNVWEWVDDEVIDGKWNDRSLPSSGYVTAADRHGIASETAVGASSTYYDDYFWSKSEGVLAMMRGGYYGTDTDGGLYSVHADIDQGLSGNAIGFRCVLNI